MSGAAPIALATLEDTQALAHRLAAHLTSGMALLLYGDLGTGKTTLARALIQALSPAPVEVTSPTFALMQPYDVRLATEEVTLWHVDLYRLEHPDEVEELGLEELQQSGVLVIEWPERLGDRLPEPHIACYLKPMGHGREAWVEGPLDV